MTDGSPYYLILHRGLVLIRYACQCEEYEKAEAIADALHNLPTELARGRVEPEFAEHFLEPLIQKHPELAELRELIR